MNWLDRLLQLEVPPDTAVYWAPVFEERCTPEKFSKGFDELDDFLGQVLHESGHLTRIEENLNYSKALRIQQVWPKRFPTPTTAIPYVNNPQKLANFVYGGRMGNVDPDDGWKYRGRGLIQVTGRDNYRALSKVLGVNVEAEPELMVRPVFALMSAIAWWEGNVPDAIMGDIVRVTKRVNGGTIGLAQREELTNKAKGTLT